MKPESCRWRSVFVLTLVGLLVVLPAVSGAADQKDDKGGGADTSVAGTVKRVLKTIDERGKDTDTSVAGTVKDAVGEANGKRVDAINRANEAMQNEWNARHQGRWTSRPPPRWSRCARRAMTHRLAARGFRST